MRFVELEVSRQNGPPRGLHKRRVAAEAIVYMEASCCGGDTTLITMLNGDELRVRITIPELVALISSEIDV